MRKATWGSDVNFVSAIAFFLLGVIAGIVGIARWWILRMRSTDHFHGFIQGAANALSKEQRDELRKDLSPGSCLLCGYCDTSSPSSEADPT